MVPFATKSSLVDLAAAISSEPLVIAPTNSVMQAITLMLSEITCNVTYEADAVPQLVLPQLQQRCGLVLEDNHLVGIITERDLVCLSASGQDLAKMSIAAVMSSPVLTLKASDFTDIFIPLHLFQRYTIQHLPLVDDQGQVIGLLTHNSFQSLLSSMDLLHLSTAAEVMTSAVIHVAPTATLAELTQLMVAHAVSCVVIVEGTGSHLVPVGIVTEHQILEAFALELDFSEVQAQTIMDTSVVSVTAETTLWSIQQQMHEQQSNQIVVTNVKGGLAGIVTPKNLLNVLNPMAFYLKAEWLAQEHIQAIQTQLKREQLLTDLATQIRASLDLDEILNAAVTTVRDFLHCDRMLVYQFQPDWSGVVVAESVGEGWQTSLGNSIVDSCFQTQALALYGAGRRIAVDDVVMGGYTDCHLKLLELYQVKANLVVPITVSGNLWGLLIGHQCATTRSWQETDLTLLDQVSVHLAISIQQAAIYQQAQAELVERQRAEADLKASEERYRQIVETTLEGVWIVDTDNRTSYVNPRMAKMLGYSVHEMLGKALFDFMDEAGRAQSLINMAHRRQGIEEQHDFRFKTKTGEDVWMLISSNPLYDDAGNYIGALGMLTDISDRKQVEATLLQNEAQSRAVLAAIPDLMFRVGKDGVYRGYITSHVEIDLVPQDFDPVGLLMDDFLPADLVERQRSAIHRVLETGEMQVYEQQMQIGDRLQYEEVRVVKSGDDEVLFMIRDISDLKRAEAEKLQAEKLRVELTILENILDTVLAGYWDADLVNGIQYISPGFKRMFGYEDHELPNSPETWKTLVFPEDLPKAIASYQHHVRSHGKVPYQTELRYRHKNGSTVWVICAGQVIEWDEVGNPLRLIGCHIDISDRKQAEIQLQQQAELDHLVNAITQHIRASLDLGEILNTTVAEVHQVLQTDRVLVYRILPDGRGQTIAESVSPSLPTILDRVFPEERFSHEKYGRYVQGQVFALTDRKLEPPVSCLPSFLRDLPMRAQLVVPIVEKNMLWGLLIAHQCWEPRPWKSWEIDALKHLSSQLAIAIQQSQLYAQLQDSHSQLAHTNTKLMRATQLKDEFLANMSHELRTPLNAILGLSESLQDGVFGVMDERQQKSIGIIERSGRHLLDLINDILELSKIEAGKLELLISTVSISQLCKSSLSFVKQQAFKKQIQLHISMAEDLGEIAVDERRIRQVLINLLTNAVKFTSSGGQVTLEVHREPKEINLMERVPLSYPMILSQSPREVDHCSLENSHSLCFSVIDTGIGIAPAHQAKLFQPFVQVDSSLNRQYEGTGLGLALVKQIVELHGGDVSLQSSPGQGSCFTVRLPYRCHREPTPALSESFDTSQTSGEPTIFEPVAALYGNNLPLILLAEDNEVNVSTISSYLEAKGYRVLVAKNGQEAIDFTKAHHPNLILMDIQMPGVDGLEAIQTIRQDKQFTQIPIIALTALAMAGDRDKCLESGASYYLTKPVKLKQLVTTMRQLLSR